MRSDPAGRVPGLECRHGIAGFVCTELAAEVFSGKLDPQLSRPVTGLVEDGAAQLAVVSQDGRFALSEPTHTHVSSTMQTFAWT